MTRRKAFTLIELLVVIAIIGILAAITFPVFMRMKEQAFKSSDLSNLNQIRTALQLYRADQGAYPPSLLGYATSYSGGIPSASDVIPANQVVGALYPKRIDSMETLRPALNRASAGSEFKLFTGATWPVKMAAPAGSDPLSYQKYGPNQGPIPGVFRCDAAIAAAAPVPNYYYNISGYDVAPTKTSAGNWNEVHYSLFWSGYTVPDTCPNTTSFGSAVDNPRQLGYSDPPETTVITWDSFFRDYDAGQVPTIAKKDVVLFLGGGAKVASSRLVNSQSWLVLP